MRRKTLILLILMCTACVVWAQYRPEGRAIVCTDGVHRYTRALYGGPGGYRVETSDRPVFALFLNSRNARNVSLRLEHEGRWLALDSTEHCKAVYGGGKRSYQLTDAAWKGGELTMEVYCLSDRDGALWHIRHQIPGGRPTLEVRSTGVKNKRLSRNGDIGVDSADSFESDGETIQLLSQCVAKDIYIAAAADAGLLFGAGEPDCLRHARRIHQPFRLCTGDGCRRCLGRPDMATRGCWLAHFAGWLAWWLSG